MANYFEGPTSQDFTIKDDDGVVGHIRMKPNSIAWKPKSGQKFYKISLDDFAAFAEKNGKEVKK